MKWIAVQNPSLKSKGAAWWILHKKQPGSCISIGTAGTREDAALMAAAPELLAVVQSVIDECEATFVDPEDMAPEWIAILKDAREVCVKATGRKVKS